MTAGPPDVTGVYGAACLLLAAAGLAKVRHPVDTAIALAKAGMPVHRQAVRVAAAAEVVIAVAGALTGGPVAPLLVAASYLAFAGFVSFALVRGLPLASCGCFGRPDSPPSWSHVVLNVGAALGALGWALTAAASLPSTLGSQGWRATPLGLGAVVVCALAALVMTNPLARERQQTSGVRG